MYDKGFEFSNAQALSTLTGTGLVSANVWDLEEVSSGKALGQTDMMVFGWVNFYILSTTNSTGNNFTIKLISSSSAALTGTLIYLGGIELMIPEIKTGNKFSFGVCRHKCERYLGIWYKTGTTLTGTTSVDCKFFPGPLTSPNDVGNQKKPNTTFG